MTRQQDCTAVWQRKVLWVAMEPSEGSVSVAVAFKRIICEHEEIDDDRACEEFLTALSVQDQQLADDCTKCDAYDVCDANDVCDTCEGSECESEEETEYGASRNAPCEIPVVGAPQRGMRCRTVIIRRNVHVSNEKPQTRAWPFTVRVKVVTCSSTTPTADCRDVVAHLQQRGLLRRRPATPSSRYSTP